MPDVKLCECGCGLPAPIAKQTVRSRGYVKGQPMRFRPGHQSTTTRRRKRAHYNNALRMARRKVREGKPCECGCGNQSQPDRRFISGHARKHGLSNSREYHSWMGMHTRCTNSNQKSWSDYGGRGIKICDRWQGKHGFENFLADMGPRPFGMTIDRYPNNNGNYEPGNCRWATPTEQSANQRPRRKAA